YLQDEQGSVIGELDKRGRLAARYTYDAFGALTEGRFDGINRLGYNGKRVDGYTGRYDYGYRAYDPLTMRWTTVDPVKDGTNWYTYVSNDPVNLIDPFGLTESDAQASANPYATWIAKPTGAPLTDEEAKVQKIFGTGEMILGGVGGVAACEVTAGGSVLIGLNVMADGANLVSEADNKRKVNPGDMYIKLITSTATGVKTQNGQDIPFQSPLP
ncbi:MAG: RHS repeat-associated core domain-containing protein, partial [Spirochaetia bacterium]|nr:RHS repeat-associated core domain-containing protein [Spirochaetia bacterium]